MKEAQIVPNMANRIMDEIDDDVAALTLLVKRMVECDSALQRALELPEFHERMKQIQSAIRQCCGDAP